MWGLRDSGAVNVGSVNVGIGYKIPAFCRDDDMSLSWTLQVRGLTWAFLSDGWPCLSGSKKQHGRSCMICWNQPPLVEFGKILHDADYI